MKKSIIFAAVAAIVLAGCAKNETYVVNTSKDAVSFGAYSGRTVTKAGSTDDMNLDALKNHGFGVFATYSETNDFSVANDNFMYNQKVNHDGSAWTYSPVKYWPNPTNGRDADAQKVSFFAYAPYAEPTGAAGEVGITGFSIDGTTNHNLVHYAFSNDKNTPNVDLMWGYKNGWDKVSTNDADRVNINLTRQTETIKFVFRHLLSKLGGSQEGGDPVLGPDDPGYVANGLMIKANAETIAPTNNFGTANGTKVTVSRLIIESAPEKDTAPAPNDTTVLDANGNPVKYATGLQTGKLDLFTGKFVLDAAATPVQFKQTLTNDASEISATPATADSKLAARIAEPTTAITAFDQLTETGVTDKAVNVYEDENSPIILVPGTAPVVDVTVTYFVRTYDAKVPGGYTQVPQTVWGRVKFPTIEENKKYNLLIILGLNDVKFEASVEDWSKGSTWNDANGNGVVDPGEVTDGTGSQDIWLPENL